MIIAIVLVKPRINVGNYGKSAIWKSRKVSTKQGHPWLDDLNLLNTPPGIEPKFRTFK